jgi:hypothetical protein
MTLQSEHITHSGITHVRVNHKYFAEIMKFRYQAFYHTLFQQLKSHVDVAYPYKGGILFEQVQERSCDDAKMLNELAIVSC